MLRWAIASDPGDRRIVRIGWPARPPDGRQERDDVWAFDPVARALMLLLEASPTRS